MVNAPHTTTAATALPGAVLPGAALPGAALPGTALPGAVLPGTALPGAVLPGTVLPESPSLAPSLAPSLDQTSGQTSGQTSPSPAPAAVQAAETETETKSAAAASAEPAVASSAEPAAVASSAETKSAFAPFTCIASGHGSAVAPADRATWERVRRSSHLADLCRQIAAGNEKLKHRLPVWTPHCAQFVRNHRSAADALKPLPRLMLDFDEKGHSEEILDRALELQNRRRWDILLVERSVRNGTHVLILLPPGMTAPEAQQRFSADIGFTADAAVKDVSRCIYQVPMDYTLYVNDSLFDPSATATAASASAGTAAAASAAAYATGTAASGNAASGAAASAAMTPAGLPAAVLAPSVPDVTAQMQAAAAAAQMEAFPPTYQGLAYADLVSTLAEQLGGIPKHGSRNQFIYAMACNLRGVCAHNPHHVAAILPTYGEDVQKHRTTVGSACQRSQPDGLTPLMQRVVDLVRRRSEPEGGGMLGATPPPMPRVLPPLIRLLLSCTPDIYRPAVAHAVFPALGAHLWRTTFTYVDNQPHEATLMNVLMAGTGAGKSCIDQPLRYILADIRRRDRENLRREKRWKEELQTKGANKDRSRRPQDIVVQEVDPDMTNAAFVMRLAEANERFLYTKMNEIDQFDALKSSASSKSQFQIMCLAFDPGNTYGQTRVGTMSVSERVSVRFNWNASTTVHKGFQYFRGVLTDGPVSRINFCTIPERPIGAPMPVYGRYPDDFEQQLKPFIDCLNEARGDIACPEATALAGELLEEHAEFARLSQSRVYENLSFRANVIGFLKGMVLYVAHGRHWSPEIAEFVRWSVRYDLWCKMRFFGAAIEEDEHRFDSTRRPGPANLLSLLPRVFTFTAAADLRAAKGMAAAKTDQMLRTWKSRGYIRPVGGAGGCFEKTEDYLLKHPDARPAIPDDGCGDYGSDGPEDYGSGSSGDLFGGPDGSGDYGSAF